MEYIAIARSRKLQVSDSYGGHWKFEMIYLEPSSLSSSGILETQDLPDPLILADGIRSFPWHINTKYYEADIHVCSMDEKTIANQAFAESVNAVIICFDSNSTTGLSTVEQWLSFTKEFEPEINMLICERCSDSQTFVNKSDGSSSSGVQKIDAQKWCVEHNFELVELNPAEDDEMETEENDFPESLGMKRVIQALHAHIWPNLKLKEISGRSRPNPGFHSTLNEFSELISSSGSEGNKNIFGTLEVSQEETGLNCSNDDLSVKVAKVKPTIRQRNDLVEGAVLGQINDEALDESLPSYEIALQREIQNGIQNLGICSGPSNSERNRRSEKIDSMLEAMDALPDENFEQLFQNLSAMKSKAVSLSPTQRRAYAEKMTLAFWRSIGGNESEIDGLSSDEEGLV